MTKREQLETAFKTILTCMVKETIECPMTFIKPFNSVPEAMIERNINLLLKEVSIRTPLK